MPKAHPRAIAGSEYAPIPPGSQELYWLVGWPKCGRRSLSGRDEPGPHWDAGTLLEDTPRVVDLTDADSALLILRRLLATACPPLRAHTLAQILLGGRWTAIEAAQLGTLCAQVWAHQPGEDHV